jgi:hypothetical protein
MCVVSNMQGELEGGGAPLSGRQRPQKKKMVFFASIFWRFFGTWFFDGFLILVKELGLLSNPSQWIRVWMSLDHILIVF